MRASAADSHAVLDAAAPLDVGNGIVVASVGSAGAWLSLGAAHPEHGFVELTGLPPFDPAWRGDADAVRRYRGWMSGGAFAFLHTETVFAEPQVSVRELRLDATVSAREVRSQPRLHTIETTAAPDRPQIVQRHRIAGARHVVLRFRGRLDAHPLAEITETDPPQPTNARTQLAADGQRLAIAAPELPATAEIAVSLTGAHAGEWTVDGDVAQLVAHPRGPVAELTVCCSLVTPGAPPPRPPAMGLAPRSFGTVRLHVPSALRPGLERIADRAHAYVLACTAFRVGERELCLLTDHRILPLSWTRDAYWQAALLLTYGHADLVADHLRWLWASCDRPHGLWSRSHHSSGAVKDRALQADQQLYPVLELADYVRATGGLPEPPHGGDPVAWWSERVAELWRALPAGRHGLLRSEENAADDRSGLPYPLSAQILYWHAAARLAALDGELRLGYRMAASAEEIRDRVGRHFAVDGPDGRQWAYEIDGRGAHRLYQDANDLPTALAPLLRFCAADDPLWAATMRFALGPRNPGFVAGPHGGLGSRHTPGTWTLGDIQEWVAASLLGEHVRARGALQRLLIAGADGLLPEAYDPHSGGAPIRRWFAWPGAALGVLLAADAER